MAASGPNLYAYAGGNPTNYADPSGRDLLAAMAAGAAHSQPGKALGGSRSDRGHLAGIAHATGGGVNEALGVVAIADQPRACYSLRRYTLLASVCLVLCVRFGAGDGPLGWN
ncbi:MAG: hypothetical protein U0841_16020 [Chloroflexia bacterium]